MSTELKRIELVVNQAVEANLIELLDAVGYGESFSYVDPVYGRGGQGRREGSPVWPETNVLVVVYMEEHVLQRFMSGFSELKKRFPNEGMRGWVSGTATRLT